MDPSVCNFLEFFLIALVGVQCVGRSEPTNPLCRTLLRLRMYHTIDVEGLLRRISCILG